MVPNSKMNWDGVLTSRTGREYLSRSFYEYVGVGAKIFLENALEAFELISQLQGKQSAGSIANRVNIIFNFWNQNFWELPSLKRGQTCEESPPTLKVAFRATFQLITGRSVVQLKSIEHIQVKWPGLTPLISSMIRICMILGFFSNMMRMYSYVQDCLQAFYDHELEWPESCRFQHGWRSQSGRSIRYSHGNPWSSEGSAAKLYVHQSVDRSHLQASANGWIWFDSSDM